eukprot:jgi/Bigna1/86069/estExt_fgenesh1_pg.C_80011
MRCSQSKSRGKLLAVTFLAVLVIAHYKLMKTIQTQFRSKYTLLMFTAVVGTLPLFFVRWAAKLERRMAASRKQRNENSEAEFLPPESELGDKIDEHSTEQNIGTEHRSEDSRHRCCCWLIPPEVLNRTRPSILLRQAVYIGVMNSLGFFASVAAITNTPLWISMALFKVDCAFNLALSVLFLGEKCSVLKVSGSLMSLAGAAVLSVSAYLTRNSGGQENTLFGDVASLSYALILSFLMVGWKFFLKDFSWPLLLTLNGMASCVQVVLMLPVLAWAYGSNTEGAHWSSPGAVIGWCLLNGFVSLLLAIWWSFCIGFTSPTYVAVAGVAVVPLTTLLDYLTDNIHLHWLDGVATAVILSGFFLTKYGYDLSESKNQQYQEVEDRHLINSDQSEYEHRAANPVFGMGQHGEELKTDH